MEKNLSTPRTPKSKFKARKIGQTPDSENKVKSAAPTTRYFPRHKSATSMHDLSLNVSSATALRKRIGSTRTSLAPSSLVNSFGLKKTETDNTDTELGFLYDDYLRTLMTDVLLKKKATDNEKKILNQLASISKEQDLGNEKLVKMKAREKDIRYLTSLQNYLDSLVTQIRSDFQPLKDCSVKDELEKLRLQLEPFDFLRCQGIDLPVSSDEQRKFEEALKKCYKSIQDVSEMLKEKGENLEKVNCELQESIEILKKLESLHKTLHSSMNCLQISVLKSTSQSLSDDMP